MANRMQSPPIQILRYRSSQQPTRLPILISTCRRTSQSIVLAKRRPGGLLSSPTPQALDDVCALAPCSGHARCCRIPLPIAAPRLLLLPLGRGAYRMPRIAARGAMVRRPPPGAPEQHSSEAMHVPPSRPRERCVSRPEHPHTAHETMLLFSSSHTGYPVSLCRESSRMLMRDSSLIASISSSARAHPAQSS